MTPGPTPPRSRQHTTNWWNLPWPGGTSTTTSPTLSNWHWRQGGPWQQKGLSTSSEMAWTKWYTVKPWIGTWYHTPWMSGRWPLELRLPRQKRSTMQACWTHNATTINNGHVTSELPCWANSATFKHHFVKLRHRPHGHQFHQCNTLQTTYAQGMSAAGQGGSLLQVPTTRPCGMQMPKEQEHLDSCQQLHLDQCKPHNHYINYQHCHPSCHNTHGATHQIETHVGTTDPCTQRRHGWWRTQCLPWLPWYGRGFLVCQNLEVASPPAVVANMYSNQKNSMTISLTVKMLHKMTKTNALLDSRATPNFINPCTIASLFMGTRDLHILLTVNNMDGSTNWGGTITQFCNLWIRHGSCVEKLGHYITNLGQDRIILGYPWFQKFNPHFDWTANTLEGDDVVIKTAGYHRCYKPSIQTMQPLPSEPTNWVEVIKLIPEH